MLASSFSTRFLLRKNRRSRSLPPLGATCSLPHFRSAQMWPRIFPRGLPGYVPLFPGWPRARTPALLVFNSVFAAQKPAQPVTGPTFWVCRAKAGAAFRCAKPPCAVVRFAAMASPPRTAILPSPSRLRRAGPPTAKPRRLLPFGRISLRETARPVIGPTGADVLPSPSRLRRAGSPTAKPRPSSFSIRFFLRKNRRARPPAFGRRGVDKVRKYHFVCVVLSSAPLTLSPLYAPARPVFRNRPKEKAAAETRCGCGISFTFPVFPPMRNKIPRMLCHSHPFNFALIPWGKQKRKARPLSFFALLQKAHFCPFCILSFLCRSRSRCRKADSYSYFAIWYNSSTASCSEPVCFSIK